MPTLHAQLTQSLLLECASGYYNPGDKLPSMRKISALWGVSDSTVKTSLLWLKDHGLIVNRPYSGWFLKPESRQKALLFLHKRTYSALPSPATFRTKHFALRSEEKPFNRFAIIWVSSVARPSPEQATLELVKTEPWSRGFFREVTRRGGEFACFYFDQKKESVAELLGRLEAAQLAGIAVFGRNFQRSPQDMLKQLTKLNIPIAVAFDDCEHTHVTSIGINNIAMGYEAGRRFLSAGHRRIGVCIPPSASKHFSDRLEGCKLIVKESLEKRAEIHPMYISEHPERKIPANVTALMEDPARRPTAVFVATFKIWIKFSKLLKKMKLAIPEDISIISCMGKGDSYMYSQPIDLFSIDFGEIGRITATKLWGLRDGTVHDKATLVEPVYHRNKSVKKLNPREGS